MAQDFHGRTALVTGAASGLGLGMARSFAAAGAKVILADVDVDGARAAAATIGQAAEAVELDVSDAAAWAAAAETARRRFGGVDVLVNNAGLLGALKPLVDIDADRIRRLIDVNVMGAVLGVQAIVPLIRARGGGHIVNTSSMAGLDSPPRLGDYALTKRALVGFSEALRDELAGEGIGVSVLCPGFVQTGLAATTGRELGEAAAQPASGVLPPTDGVTPELVGEMVLDGIRENRFFILTHAAGRARIEMRLQALYEAMDRVDRRG